MPVTAKLSRKFYEKFGDDVPTSSWIGFNMVDATYRSDLRELNDLNFARFDAKLAADAVAQARDTTHQAPRFGSGFAQAATTAGLVFGVVKLLALGHKQEPLSARAREPPLPSHPTPSLTL